MDNLVSLLKRKLELSQKVVTYKYNIGWDVYEFVKDNLNNVVKFDTFNDALSFHKLTINDLSNQDKWVTYDRCRRLEFFIEDDTLFVKVTHCTKETTFNYKYCSSEDTIKTLWEATIKLPFEFLLKIEHLIDAKFDEFCSQSYIDYLESKRLEWIENFKKEILKP
jgi:hypothetical protein